MRESRLAIRSWDTKGF